MYANGKRMMAWVAKIDKVVKHPEADSLDICTVGGWQCVTKLGEYKQGDLVVYVSIDSWVPTELAPFLSKGKELREYNGVKGERLRTIKLRGQLSQGLILPTTGKTPLTGEGDDLTEFLGIQKWEKPIPAQLSGQVRGNFPTEVPKTDLVRVQNLVAEVTAANETGLKFQIEEKLEGSSCTFFLDMEGVFRVCSRNLDLKFDENNTYWRAAIKYDVERKLKELEAQRAWYSGYCCSG